MSVWCVRGRESIRFDGIRRFGRPPVLAPPAWALVERVWRGIGADPPEQNPAGPGLFEELAESIPPAAARLVLVVPDGTRVGPWRGILPEAMRAIRSRSRPDARRTLLVAGGAHAVQAAGSLLRHLFPGGGGLSNLLEGWTVTQNRDGEFCEHIPVGTTPEGTPVRLHPEYVRADYRILLGEVSWHYFAGFGGGRKLVFPGLADPAGISANHRRAVRCRIASAEAPGPSGREPAESARPRTARTPTTWIEGAGVDAFEWRDDCGPGILEGNPVHEDLVAAVALQPPDWVVTVVEEPPSDPDPSCPVRFPSSVVQGRYPAAFEEASARFERSHRIPLTLAPSLVIADAGGAPRDATFLQAHKSLQHALRFLAPRGRLLLVAACDEGFGSPMLSRFASNPDGFCPADEARRDPMAVLHIQTLVALRRALPLAEVGLWSELPEGAVRALGIRPLASWDEALDWARGGGGAPWGWLPRAERFLPERKWRGGCLR